jgi:hypothetical protein
MTEPTPIHCGKCDVSYFISCNPRRIIEAHVEHLAEEMRHFIKDMEHPIFVCVPPHESAIAKTSLEQKKPFACKIIVKSKCIDPLD